MTQKPFAKKITLFLIDGIPHGRQSCELSNWTGKTLKIPRTLINESNDREELLGPGVYLLFGKDIDNPEKDMVYIGESETLFDRLKQQVINKDFWTEAVAIFSKDENLNKAHIKYLEFRMHELAQRANRFKIENSQSPSCSSISEADKAEMEEFLENIKLIINTLGYKVFTEIQSESKAQKSNIYYIKAARGAEGKGQLSPEGFIVFKDSVMTSETVPSMPQWIDNIRKNIINENIVKLNNDNNYIFLQDYLFNSPSAAAAVIMGRSANGQKEWKNSKGISLSDIEKNIIAGISPNKA